MLDNNIPQLSKEWFEQRKGRITGSRIGAILGLSPWQKPQDVLRAMVREYHGAETEFKGNPATQHGNMHERQAILAFMRETDMRVDECGFFEYGERLGASPDGLTSDGGILEIKCPFSLRNGGEFKPLADQPHYEAQMQMEMLAADRNHAYFAQYIPSIDKLSIERVDRDAHWIDKVLPQVNEFYALYRSELNNKAHLEPLRKEVNSNIATRLVKQIMALREEQKQLKESERELMDELIKLTGGVDADIGGHKLTLVKRKGSISYAKAIKELAPDADLEQWRGEGSEAWRLT